MGQFCLASPVSIRICVPNLVVSDGRVERGGVYRQTDRHRDSAALYSRLRDVLRGSVLRFALVFEISAGNS